MSKQDLLDKHLERLFQARVSGGVRSLVPATLQPLPRNADGSRFTDAQERKGHPPKPLPPTRWMPKFLTALWALSGYVPYVSSPEELAGYIFCATQTRKRVPGARNGHVVESLASDVRNAVLLIDAVLSGVGKKDRKLVLVPIELRNGEVVWWSRQGHMCGASVNPSGILQSIESVSMSGGRAESARKGRAHDPAEKAFLAALTAASSGRDDRSGQASAATNIPVRDIGSSAKRFPQIRRFNPLAESIAAGLRHAGSGKSVVPRLSERYSAGSMDSLMCWILGLKPPNSQCIQVRVEVKVVIIKQEPVDEEESIPKTTDAAEADVMDGIHHSVHIIDGYHVLAEPGEVVAGPRDVGESSGKPVVTKPSAKVYFAPATLGMYAIGEDGVVVCDVICPARIIGLPERYRTYATIGRKRSREEMLMGGDEEVTFARRQRVR